MNMMIIQLIYAIYIYAYYDTIYFKTNIEIKNIAGLLTLMNLEIL